MKRWQYRTVVPLFFAPVFWGLTQYGATAPQSVYRLFLLAALPVALAVLLSPAGRTRQLVLLAVGALLVLGVSLAESLTSVGWSRIALGWMALFVACSVSRDHPGRVRSLAILLVGFGMFEALFGLLQTLGGTWNERQILGVATGTFINKNHFAGFMNMTIPLAAGMVLAVVAGKADRSRQFSEALARAWIAILAVALISGVLFLSASRAGVLVLLLTLLFLALLLTLDARKRAGRTLRLAGWVLLAVTLGLGLTLGVNALFAKFLRSHQDLVSRTTLYRESLNVVAEAPWSGVGVDMFAWRFRPYRTRDPQGHTFYAHNDYLQTAAEWGIPLALGFWSFVIWRFWRSVRVFWEARDPWLKGLGLGCAGSIFTILVHSLMDFNLYIPVNWMIFCTVLGLAWACSDATAGEPA